MVAECSYFGGKLVPSEPMLSIKLSISCSILPRGKERLPNAELDERICEKSEMEFELRIWKSFVERLRSGLEENLVMCKELENSLLAQVDFTESLKQEKDSLVFKLEEKENKIECLQQHVYYLNKNQK